jgi:hypothetical protein
LKQDFEIIVIEKLDSFEASVLSTVFIPMFRQSGKERKMLVLIQQAIRGSMDWTSFRVGSPGRNLKILHAGRAVISAHIIARVALMLLFLCWFSHQGETTMA